MSELSRLHRKIVDEMSPQPPQTRRAAFPDPAIARPDPADCRPHPSERFSILRPAIAASGVLASIAILSAGFGTELILLPIGLSIAGIVGTGMMLSDWRRSAPALSAAAERSGDRDWEAREADTARFAIHDALGDIAILRDAHGVILVANETFRAVTGETAPEGRCCDAVGLDLRPVGTSGRYRVDFVSGQGPRSFDWHDVLTREPAGGTLRIVSVGRDITAEVDAARDSEKALRRAEAESRAKSHLLATVSHEIRTPLSGILGMSELLDQTRLTAQQSNYLAGMRQSGHDLVQLVDDLLDCASMEAGRFVLRSTRQTLRPLVESVVEILSHRAHAKGIEIASTVAADVPDMLEIDGPRLKQVLFNVVGNAVKFTATGGVLVSACEQLGMLVVRVTDTGPGMTAVDQARIFDAFEQAGDTDARAGGTGLGLSISRRIVNAFGGDITVTSRLGAGSVFEIRLPLKAAGASDAAKRTRLLAGSRILLVAPKGPASQALAATIETLGGRCRVASTLGEGQRLLELAGMPDRGEALTDIIVDHRHAGLFREICTAVPDLEGLALRKTYLVNPEERGEQPLHQTDGFHAWLIRPLRERSLVAVLKGHMKGIEVRDAINDNRPVLRDDESALEASGTRPSGSLLLGEDDPVNAAVLRATLARVGHAVTHAHDFAEMAHHLKGEGGHGPALVITDLNMPGGDGLAMLKDLRRREALSVSGRRLPVIVQTSDARAETRHDLLQAGADAVFVKPADPAALIETVSRLLAGSRFIAG